MPKRHHLLLAGQSAAPDGDMPPAPPASAFFVAAYRLSQTVSLTILA